MGVSANIHPNAKIGYGTTVEPFATVGDNVIIGENCWIGPGAVLMAGTRLGNNCKVFPGAVIGAIPQDLKFKGEDTTCEIGDDTTIRECVTINRGTSENHKTSIGKNCLIMAYVHVAHDCEIGNSVILTNNVTLAGHVIIEDFAILEGLVAVQQFVRIGAHAFVTGSSLVRKNVPPFVKAAREPLAYAGINSIGLKRRGIEDKTISAIETISKNLFVLQKNLSAGMQMVENEIPESPEKEQILSFIKSSEKGVIRSMLQK
jgi:UDP-N-acetylglucosamine acyltransferase